MASVNCNYSVTGTGPCIIFVHGIGASKSTWNSVIKHLESDFTCVSYDLRGHGDSPTGEFPYSLEDLVNDVEVIRRQLNIKKMHIVGHSLGGMIGPLYALNYPKQTLSVSLLSTAAFRTEDDKSKVNAVLKSMHEKGIERILGTLTNRWFTDDFIEQNSIAVESRLQQVLDTNPEVFLEVFRIYAETEMSPWLNLVTKPCLVLTGENDGGCSPRLNKLIAEELPNSELCILKDYKHSLLIEAPDQVAQQVYKFLLSKNPI